MPETSFQPKRKDNLATETKSPVKPQPVRGSGSSSQPRANKQYSFKDEHVDSLFKLLNKSNRLKLSEARRPKEVDKTIILTVGTCFDEDICEAFHLELYHTTISRVLHDQDFPKRVDMMCFVNMK